MNNFVDVIPAKAGIQLSYQFIIYINLNIDIANIFEFLDSSLRWNDMGNCYPDFEPSRNCFSE